MSWRKMFGRIQQKRRLLLTGVAIVLLFIAIFFWQPLLISWHLSRARGHLFDRNNVQALEQLRTALRVDPDHTETLFLLARTYRRLGDLKKASALLRRATSLGGDSNRAERETWLMLAQTGSMRKAEPHLDELLMDPRDDGSDICEAYVNGYFTNMRPNIAMGLIDVWEKSYPTQAQPHFMRAFLFEALSYTREAEKSYKKGLKLDPNRTLMRCRLGSMLLDLHNLEEANKTLQRCVDEAPKNTKVLTTQAHCFFMQGKSKEAAQVLQRAIRIAPHDFDALQLLGEIKLSEGQFEESLKYLQVAVKERPYDTTARNALGRTLRSLGRDDEAKEHFDYVAEAEGPLHRMEQQLMELTTHPENVELRYQIGTTLLKYGSRRDGVKWLRTVLEIQPDHPGALKALGDYLHNYQGEPKAGASPPGGF